MRFKENNYNSIFVGLSNFIRYVCGGDRLKRITKIIDVLLTQAYFKKNKKLKILGSGEIKKNIEISAHFASKQALAKIEKAGGKISIVKK